MRCFRSYRCDAFGAGFRRCWKRRALWTEVDCAKRKKTHPRSRQAPKQKSAVDRSVDCAKRGRSTPACRQAPKQKSAVDKSVDEETVDKRVDRSVDCAKRKKTPPRLCYQPALLLLFSASTFVHTVHASVHPLSCPPALFHPHPLSCPPALFLRKQKKRRFRCAFSVVVLCGAEVSPLLNRGGFRVLRNPRAW